MEDNHFVAHPNGGIAFKGQTPAEETKPEEKVEEAKPESTEEIAENRDGAEEKEVAPEEKTDEPAEEAA
jgi:hypothetical protein